MRLTGIAMLAVAALLVAMQTAAADPKHGGHGNGHGKPEKQTRHGRGNSEAHFDHSGPPPWAPAHG